MDEHCVVVGIGNPYLQDDRAGVVIVEALERAGLACRIEVVYTVGPEVMDRIRGFRRAIIVDACLLGYPPPGTILELGLDDLCEMLNGQKLPGRLQKFSLSEVRRAFAPALARFTVAGAGPANAQTAT